MHFSSRKQLNNWQSRRVKDFLNRIIRRSAFYRSLYQGKRSNELVVINKAVFMKNFDTLNTAGITLTEALAIAQKAEDCRDFVPTCRGYTVGLSSGTSGVRGVFLVSRLERAKWCGTILAKMLPNGLFSPTKIAFFLRADSNLYETINSRLLKFKFFDLKKDFSQHIKTLQNFQPDVLVAPPLVLDLISSKQRVGELSLVPRKIISVADVLYKDIKCRIEDIFQLPVHQIYQATEGFLGCTCKEGNLHLNEDLIHFDKKILDKETGKFIPIITDFNRTTQPIIGYELNDILTEDPTPCPCGSPMVRLKQIEGRADDILFFRDDNGEEKIIFPDFIVRLVLRIYPNIGNFQVVQTKENVVQVSTLLDSLQQEALKHAFERFFVEQGLKVQCVFKAFPREVVWSIKNKRVIRKLPKTCQ